jgi:hypothetical protein
MRRQLFGEERAERARRRQIEEETRAQAGATVQKNIMLQIAGGDPNRAIEIFGDRFLTAVHAATGVELPIEEIPITAPVAERRQVGVQLVPRTAPPPDFQPRVRGLDEPILEGEPPYGFEEAPVFGDVTEQRPTGQVRRVIRGTMQPEMQLPDFEIQVGGRPIRFSQLMQMAQQYGLPAGDLAQVFIRGLGLQDPNQAARLALDVSNKEFDQQYRLARFKWQKMTEAERSEVERLEREWQREYGLARIAIARGQLAEAKRHNRAIEALTLRMREIQERHARVAEGRLAIEQLQAAQPAAAETLAGLRLELTQRYIRDPEALTDAERRILFGAAGEEVLPARDRELLRVWRDNIDPISGQPRDPQLAEQLRPSVDRIINFLTRPPGRREQVVTYTTREGRVVTSQEVINMIRQALARGATRDQVRRALIRDGIPPERFGF